MGKLTVLSEASCDRRQGGSTVAVVMSTESVQTPFAVGLLWHSLIFKFMTFGEFCWVFFALKSRFCTGISHGCARIVLSL